MNSLIQEMEERFKELLTQFAEVQEQKLNELRNQILLNSPKNSPREVPSNIEMRRSSGFLGSFPLGDEPKIGETTGKVVVYTAVAVPEESRIRTQSGKSRYGSKPNKIQRAWAEGPPIVPAIYNGKLYQFGQNSKM